MFTSTRDKYQVRRYCADCADTNREVRDELAAAYTRGELAVSDASLEIGDHRCVACECLIRDVPAYQGEYRVEVELTFPVTVTLKAKCATDAEFRLADVLEGANFRKATGKIESVIDALLNGRTKVTADDYRSVVLVAKRLPPEQGVFLVPGQ
jgi:hypothetical protein